MALGEELKRTCPPGYRVRVSGSGFSLPVIAWVAVLDPDQTKTAQEGIYIVYLYSADMTRLYLSLNQGFTAHQKRAESITREQRKASKTDLALASITSETEVIRSELSTLVGASEAMLSCIGGGALEIDLGHVGDLANGYEAGHIAGFGYEMDSLPDDEVLHLHLTSLLSLYASACEIADRHTLLEPDTWVTRSGSLEYKRRVRTKREVKFDDFKPRKFDDLVIELEGSSQLIRTRKHEELISRFGIHAQNHSLELTNQKIGKMDLLMRDANGVEYLIEAKTVTGDGEAAVRDAIGQLFAYRHEYYTSRKRPHPKLVALFNQPVKGLWRDLLEELHIDYVYCEGSRWDASSGVASLFE
jgi:hypothetical protein